MIMKHEGDLDLDQMTQRLQNLFKFKNFYDQVDFNREQMLTIMKAIIELTNMLGSSNLVESRTRRNNKFDDNAVVFNENDQGEVPSQHNRPLQATVKVRDVEPKRTMLDQRSSLNIIVLSVLDIVGVSRENITR